MSRGSAGSGAFEPPDPEESTEGNVVEPDPSADGTVPAEDEPSEARELGVREQDARGSDVHEPGGTTTATYPAFGIISRLRGIEKRYLVAGMGLLLAFTFAFFTALFLWWDEDPKTPLEELGFEREKVSEAGATGDAATGQSQGGAAIQVQGSEEELADDPEQLAFLERQKDRAKEIARTSESFEAERGVTLTDRELIHRLGGQWRLDLGGRPALAEFAPVVVDRVRRGSLLVELYPVESRHLPPFFTVFELPERGTFIAFRDADGSYRLVLEEVRFHGPDHFSYRLGQRGKRRHAMRLGGTASPPGGGRFPERLEEADPGDPRWFEERSEEGNLEDPAEGGREEVRIVVEPPPPVEEMWRVAEDLRDAGRLHSLRRQLEKIRNAYPRHRQARRWNRRVDGWIRDQRKDLVDTLGDRLEDLKDGIRDRDLEEIFEQWDERPDPSTRRFFTELVGRHEHLEARIAIHGVEVDDGVTDFSATVTLEGWSGRRRDREIIPHRWRGQLQSGHFVTPFR